MTIIAYRDGIMAADSGIYSDGACIGSCEKIFRLNSGALYGAAGAMMDDQMLRQIMSQFGPNFPLEDFLNSHWNVDIQILLAMPDDSVHYIFFEASEDGEEPTIIRYQMDAPFHALGHARWIAFGAMAAGSSAADAVACAIPHAVYARGPVQALAMEKKKQETNGMAKAKLGSGKRFAALKKKIAAKGNVSNPAAVAAAIGRAKYGKKKFQKLASRGKKRK